MQYCQSAIRNNESGAQNINFETSCNLLYTSILYVQSTLYEYVEEIRIKNYFK